ncbi:protein-glutamate O-methyltransferase CheR [bacterium 1XD42-1]|nr:protein-glutamate O-methyltransferase CheR [Oscillospiraceae bacterium]RKJ56460.1 protein-glutamate O-methyltransferase CheR [bacterium 1XD42-8]RKJ64819.1 protein-glutamate O-methyltransferase CheR [bacterium 1XD42-1]
MVQMSDQEFMTLTKYIKDHYGINLTKKRVLIEGRMSSVLRSRNIPNFKAYLDILFNDKTGAEMTTLLNKLTTNHTYFLRENEHFNYLAQEALPYLERVHGNDHSLRIWSAGCSSGQEPYTIAMALNEYFGTRRSLWKIQLLATDISVNVLTKACNGIYENESLNDVPQLWKTKYFKRLPDGNFQVSDSIRKSVDFRTLNLMDPFRFRKPFDIIFCRNVMIYFDGPTKEKLVNKFYDWSTEGGFFFIGHSENINKDTTRYRFIKPAIYQKGSRK